MKKNLLLLAAVGGMFMSANNLHAQDTTVSVEEVVLTESVDCKDHYSCSWRDNWNIQLGAGVFGNFTERNLEVGDPKVHYTALYNIGVGHWFSPYMGFRFTGYYGAMHWDAVKYNKAKYANLNLDFMWDMLNSIAGPNPNRVFSIIPFVGLGGTYTWDYGDSYVNINGEDGKPKSNSWTLPVSAGIQLRLRLCKYVDFFAEGRMNAYGDNLNNFVNHRSIDVIGQVYGGFIINIGGRKYTRYNPCDYMSYINTLNNQVNDLRADLAATSAALATAEAQLPCPEVVAVEQTTTVEAPMMASVRFRINSARISNEEMVNVYNTAEWLKANPGVKILVRGYADKDTGTSSYNMDLSKRRAQAVADALVNDYGIASSRIAVEGFGSDTQVYDTNNWNRIVIFSLPE